MFDSFWQFLQHQMQTNQIFSGGLVLMIGGAILALCREVPGKIWAWIKSIWIIEIDLLDRDPAFEWLDQHAHLIQANSFSRVHSEDRLAESDCISSE